MTATVSPLRCKCSHPKAAHWTDRRGRTVCIYPCGCIEFRPAVAS